MMTYICNNIKLETLDIICCDCQHIFYLSMDKNSIILENMKILFQLLNLKTLKNLHLELNIGKIEKTKCNEIIYKLPKNIVNLRSNLNFKPDDLISVLPHLKYYQNDKKIYTEEKLEKIRQFSKR